MMPAFNFQQMKKMFIFVLNRFRPDTKTKNVVIQQRLAFLYAFIGWHGFIYTFYRMTKNTSLNPEEQKQALISTAQDGGKTVEYTRIKGFSAKTSVIESKPTIVSSNQ